MSEIPNYSIIVKLVLLGESSVGKSNLLYWYTQDKFDINKKATIGMDFISSEATINNHPVKT